MVRFLFLLFACASLSGCVGAVTESTQTKVSPQMCPQQGAGDLVPCSTAQAEAFSEEQILALWGPPTTRGVKDGQDYFVYESAETALHGVIVAVIVPIPLVSSSGHYDTILYFAQDRLVKTSQQSANTAGGACSPIFMFEGPDTSPCVH